MPLGSFEFKNVEEPMEVFTISNQGFTVPKKEEMKGKLKTPAKKNNSGMMAAALVGLLLLLSVSIFRNSIFPASKAALKSLAILPFGNTMKDSAISFYQMRSRKI